MCLCHFCVLETEGERLFVCSSVCVHSGLPFRFFSGSLLFFPCLFMTQYVVMSVGADFVHLCVCVHFHQSELVPRGR